MQHVRLLIQRCQIGSTGNVCAGYACPVIDGKSCRIVCNAGSQDRDLIGSCRRCLQGSCCICQNQVNIRRYKLVDNRCTGMLNRCRFYNMEFRIRFTCNLPVAHITIVRTINLADTLCFNNRSLECFGSYNCRHTDTVAFRYRCIHG